MTKLRDDEEGNKDIIIGESTPVRIGLIIGFLSVFAASIWWASSINSKLDSILAFQASTQTAISELKAQDIAITKEIAEIKLKEALYEVALKSLQEKSATPSK